MFAYVWPIGLVVLSNILYQICAKETPASINPLASLTVTYLVAALISGVLYYFLNKGGNILREYRQLNWSAIVLGLVIVGLEVGVIYAYKAGWEVSREYIVQSSFLAVALLGVGALLYHEALNPSKLIGVLICIVGLYFINR